MINKIRKSLLLVSFIMLSSCMNSPIYEYHEFSHFQNASISCGLGQTLNDGEKLVVYGNPYKLYFSVKAKEPSSISFKLFLKSEKGEVLYTQNKIEYALKPDRDGDALIFREKITLDYKDHFMKLDYFIKNEEGKIIEKNQIRERLKYTYRKESSRLPL